MPLRAYQTQLVERLSNKIAEGQKRLVAVLPTGGGKTEVFAEIIGRYTTRADKNVVILVHREELMRQARQKIYDRQGIIAEKIEAGVKYCPPARVWVCMVETAFKRLKKNPNFFKNVGLAIVDEGHLDHFSKTFPFFQDVITIAFTASPISADKRRPLKSFYDDIIVGAQIDELIQHWHDTQHTEGLVPNITFNTENVSHEELRVAGRDFDEAAMSAVYSTGKHIQNTVKAYEKFCVGKKTLIFNCNKDHSILVDQAFREAGYPSRYLDSDAPESVRADTLKWFRDTPDAILNNIGILTTGFDEPSIQWIIVNKATMSLSLWLQMNGRGSRPYPGKLFFGTIDMGNNWMMHGEWSNYRDWERIFKYPEEPIEGGIGGVKCCSNCGCLIPVSARTCKFCETLLVQTTEQLYDQANLEFKLVTKKIPVHINVGQIMEETKNNSNFYALHKIKHQLVGHYKVDTITDDIANQLLELYQQKVEEWCRLSNKNYDQWMKEKSGKWLLDELHTIYSYALPTFTLKF